MSALDVLYRDSVTIFNRYEEDGTVVWIPHYIQHVHLTTDRAMMVNTFGDASSDNAMLNIMYRGGRTSPTINGMKHYNPKDFARLSLDTAKKSITFQFGDEYSFIIRGEYKGDVDTDGTVHDSDYMKNGGFFSYMNRHYDDVYAITGASRYDLIPHFSITAR